MARGSWLALAIVLAIPSGCPLPGGPGDAGEDEVGEDTTGEDTTGESGDPTSADTTGESGVTANDEDIRPPDDANPDDEDTGTDSGEGTEGEDTGEDGGGESGDAGECWDLTSADGILPIVVSEDTSSFADDQLGSCGQFPAPDYAFGFTAPFTGEFVFDTTGSSFDTVLYLDADECGDELACSDDFIGLSSKLVVPLVAGEIVTVVVDGFDANQAGPFVLTIDEYVAPVCEAELIAPTLPTIVLGDTTGAADQHAGGCGGQASPDTMYRFVAPGPGLYRFHTFGSAFDTVLYVWDECEGPELGCSDDANLELQSEVVVELAGGQAVWVTVDGSDSAAFGPYQLNVQKL